MVKAGDSEGKKGEGGRRGGGRGGLTWSSFIDDINMDSSIEEVFLILYQTAQEDERWGEVQFDRAVEFAR